MWSLGLSYSVVVVLSQVKLNFSEPHIKKSNITNSDDHTVNAIFSEFGLMLCETGRLSANGSR